MDNCHFSVKTMIVCASIIGLYSSTPVYVNNATTAETPSEPTTSVVAATSNKECICTCMIS